MFVNQIKIGLGEKYSGGGVVLCCEASMLLGMTGGHRKRALWTREQTRVLDILLPTKKRKQKRSTEVVLYYTQMLIDEQPKD